MPPDSWNIVPVQAAPAREPCSRRGSPEHTVLSMDNIPWSEEGEEIKDKAKGNAAMGNWGRDEKSASIGSGCFSFVIMTRVSPRMNSLVFPFILYGTSHAAISILPVEKLRHKFDVTSLKTHN